jgi:hypothetical protein
MSTVWVKFVSFACASISIVDWPWSHVTPVGSVIAADELASAIFIVFVAGAARVIKHEIRPPGKTNVGAQLTPATSFATLVDTSSVNVCNIPALAAVMIAA